MITSVDHVCAHVLSKQSIQDTAGHLFMKEHAWMPSGNIGAKATLTKQAVELPSSVCSLEV